MSSALSKNNRVPEEASWHTRAGEDRSEITIFEESGDLSDRGVHSVDVVMGLIKTPPGSHPSLSERWKQQKPANAEVRIGSQCESPARGRRHKNNPLSPEHARHLGATLRGTLDVFDGIETNDDIERLSLEWKTSRLRDDTPQRGRRRRMETANGLVPERVDAYNAVARRRERELDRAVSCPEIEDSCFGQPLTSKLLDHATPATSLEEAKTKEIGVPRPLIAGSIQLREVDRAKGSIVGGFQDRAIENRVFQPRKESSK